MKKPKILIAGIILMLLLTYLFRGWYQVYFSDPFYRHGSGFDYIRFPLIKPYYVIRVLPGEEWNIPLYFYPPTKGNYSRTGDIWDVERIAYENNIFITLSKVDVTDIKRKNGPRIYTYTVLIPDESIAWGFDSESELMDYLRPIGITDLSWRTPLEILQEYDQTWCLEWIPSCNFSKR